MEHLNKGFHNWILILNFELFNKRNHKIEHSFNVFVRFISKRCSFCGTTHTFCQELTDFIGVVMREAVLKEHTHDLKEMVSWDFVKDYENNFVGGFGKLIFIFKSGQTDIN